LGYPLNAEHTFRAASLTRDSYVLWFLNDAHKQGVAAPQRALRLDRLRAKQHAARVPVQSMDDPRPQTVAKGVRQRGAGRERRRERCGGDR
jgi:hypothetical protein